MYEVNKYAKNIQVYDVETPVGVIRKYMYEQGKTILGTGYNCIDYTDGQYVLICIDGIPYKIENLGGGKYEGKLTIENDENGKPVVSVPDGVLLTNQEASKEIERATSWIQYVINTTENNLENLWKTR